MLDCLVIGAGHCGLLAAHELQCAGLNYRVIEQSERVGEIWRQRPRNLTLFTSRRFCALADMPMPGDQNGFPAALEFAEHVENFARSKQLQLTLGVRVTRLSRVHGGVFEASLSNGETLRARCVINATGSNQHPHTPEYAARLAPQVTQLNAQNYRDASQFSSGQRVAVIGDGASGRQIAQELAQAGMHVMLARGRLRKLMPNTVLGKDLFWWLSKLGILYAAPNSLVGKILRKRDPIPAAAVNDARLEALGVELCARAVGAESGEILFAAGSKRQVDAVIWCVGYQENDDWVDLPAWRAGQFIDCKGLSAEAGLFVLGRKWLSCRASELVLGAGHDAALVVRLVRDYCKQTQQEHLTQEAKAYV